MIQSARIGPVDVPPLPVSLFRTSLRDWQARYKSSGRLETPPNRGRRVSPFMCRRTRSKLGQGADAR
jgi:hypothetical protein